MKKNILISVVMAATVSMSMVATPTLDTALSTAQQAINDAYEAGYEAGRNEGTETGLAAGLQAGDLADGEKNLDDPNAVAAETLEVEKEMQELMNNPEKMDAIMQDPEFQSFLKEIESNPEMAKQLGIPTKGSDKDDDADQEDDVEDLLDATDSKS
jgi:flagellar biosynthesis/type III secretory pathway protein FliH